MSRPLTALVLAALLFGLTLTGIHGATAQAAGCANRNINVAHLSNRQVRTALACLLNRERVRTGRQKVIRNRKLKRAASYHTADMQRMGFLTHLSSNGESATYRIHNRFGYGLGSRSWAVGEILGECFGRGCTPGKIFRLWMDSSTHRRVIHRWKWIHFGIGARHGTAENPARNAAITVTVDWGYRSG